MNANRTPWRYLPTHALDVARGPLLLFVLVSAGLALVIWRLVANEARPPAPEELLSGLVSGTLMIAVLFATGGTAGVDIKQGYYRAYFSKPMAPWWFYLQRWLLGGVAVMLVPLFLGLGLQLAMGNGTGLDWEIFGHVALGFLLVGGVVLLASTVTARDWLLAFMIYFLQARLQNVKDLFEVTGNELPWTVDKLHAILPPFHLAAPGKDLPTGTDLIHALAYGVALVTVALLVLAWRPLGSGGRA